MGGTNGRESEEYVREDKEKGKQWGNIMAKEGMKVRRKIVKCCCMHRLMNAVTAPASVSMIIAHQSTNSYHDDDDDDGNNNLA